MMSAQEQEQVQKQKTQDSGFNEHRISSVIERSTNTMWGLGYGATHTLLSHAFNRTNLGKKIVLVLTVAAVFEVLEELF
jgi:hypothetical protein